MKIGLRQHLEELTRGTLIDRHVHQLALAIEEKCFGNPINGELLMDLSIRQGPHHVARKLTIILLAQA